jgi:hypothetical protein
MHEAELPLLVLAIGVVGLSGLAHLIRVPYPLLLAKQPGNELSGGRWPAESRRKMAQYG